VTDTTKDIEALVTLAPRDPAAGVVVGDGPEVMARIMDTPARSRRARKGIAVGGVALGVVAAAAVAVTLVITAETTRSERLGGDPAPSGAERQGVEFELGVNAAPGVDAKGQELLDLGASVLRSRAAALGIEGFEVTSTGGRLFAFVPRATEPEPSSALLGDAPFGVYDSTQIIQSGSHPYPLVRAAQRLMKPNAETAMWYVIKRNVTKRFGTRMSVVGPFFARSAAEVLVGKNGELVPLSSDLIVLSERGIRAPERKAGLRNVYHLVKGLPAATGAQVVQVRWPRLVVTSELANLLNRRGDTLTALARRRERFLFVQNGDVMTSRPVDAPSLRSRALLRINRIPRQFQPVFLPVAGHPSSLIVNRGGAVIFERLASRVLADPSRPAPTTTPVPSGLLRLIAYDQRITRNAPPAVKAKVVRRESLRVLVERPKARFPFAVWSGLRQDGAERLFVISLKNPGRTPTQMSQCVLTVVSPAVTICGGMARRPKFTPAQVFGRAAPDVASVTMEGRGSTRTIPVDGGWFVFDTSNPGRSTTMIARDAQGREVGRGAAFAIGYFVWP
jgi:hypothetical protein